MFQGEVGQMKKGLAKEYHSISPQQKKKKEEE